MFGWVQKGRARMDSKKGLLDAIYKQAAKITRECTIRQSKNLFLDATLMKECKTTKQSEVAKHAYTLSKVIIDYLYAELDVYSLQSKSRDILMLKKKETKWQQGQ